MEPAGLNRLKAALQPGDCVKVAALNRLGRSLTEVLERLSWLRENQVEVISLRESIDQDSAMGRAMLRHSHVLKICGESYWLREKRQPGIFSSHHLLGAAAENGNYSYPD